MTIVDQNLTIHMFRPTLDQLPMYDLPPSYQAHWYAPGDERDWVEIHRLADRYNTATEALFLKEFGSDSAQLAERQLYIQAPDRALVGTASAWYDGDDPATPLGRVHWVAILPEYQGRSLAKPLLSLVCHRLRALGHQQATLGSSTARVPAINLYQQFGFVPQISTPDDRAIWQALAPFLKTPVVIPS